VGEGKEAALGRGRSQVQSRRLWQTMRELSAVMAILSCSELGRRPNLYIPCTDPRNES
jgi:hypothetical protein